MCNNQPLSIVVSIMVFSCSLSTTSFSAAALADNGFTESVRSFLKKPGAVVANIFTPATATSAASNSNTSQPLTKLPLAIYEQPNQASKSLMLLKEDEPLIPIIYSADKKWLKVANPANGVVGWVKLSSFSQPLIVTHVSPDGRKVAQQILLTNKPGQPQFYSSSWQYQASQPLTLAEKQKITKQLADMRQQFQALTAEMKANQEKMQATMQGLVDSLLVVN